MKIIDGISSDDRISKLKQLLDDELKSDNPSSTYIADLQLSIKHLQGRLA